VVLADGFVVNGLTVSGGQVTLGFDAGIRSAGLAYESEVQTLELEREEQPTRGRKKSTAYLVCRVDNTRGIHIGSSESTVAEVKERAYEMYNDPTAPNSMLIRHPLGPGWEDEIRLIIRQPNPLPFSLLSVIPEYTFGD
jgi:hypothetical protein